MQIWMYILKLEICLVLYSRVEWIRRRTAQDKAPSRNLLVVMFSTIPFLSSDCALRTLCVFVQRRKTILIFPCLAPGEEWNVMCTGPVIDRLL
jgi:hypothetical protein